MEVGGLWKGLKPAFWELSQAPLLTFFPEKHHPQGLDPGCYFWQRPLLMPRPTQHHPSTGFPHRTQHTRGPVPSFGEGTEWG